jgi:hypothetical protein
MGGGGGGGGAGCVARYVSVRARVSCGGCAAAAPRAHRHCDWGDDSAVRGLAAARAAHVNVDRRCVLLRLLRRCCLLRRRRRLRGGLCCGALLPASRDGGAAPHGSEFVMGCNAQVGSAAHGSALHCSQAHPCCPASGLRTKSQLLTLPSGSGMNGCVSSCRHSPSTMNLYWWYLCRRQHGGGAWSGSWEAAVRRAGGGRWVGAAGRRRRPRQLPTPVAGAPRR